MTAGARLTVALVIAQCLQLPAWRELTRDPAVPALAAAAIVLAGALGLRGRARGWRPGTVVALQVAGVGAVVWAGLGAVYGLGAAEQFVTLIPDGVAFILGSGVPMLPDPGVTVIFAGAAGLLAVAADALAVPRGRPAWGVVAVVALHLVTALGLITATLWTEFALMAAGAGLVLWAGADPAGLPRRAVRLTALAVAGAITAGAAGLAWVLAPAVPAFERRPVSDPLQMSDPTLDLKRNLVEGSDEVVIRYTTDDGEGSYLKLATLPALSTNGFGLAEARVATGRMPGVPGSPAGEARTTVVSVGAFRSEWLPVPQVPTAFDAPGEWGFSLDTLDVMALASPTRTSASEGIDYEVRSLRVNPTAEVIARADAGRAPRPELTLALPDGVPARVRALAQEIAADAPTAGAKAQAIEDYLRSSRFTYSTAASVDGDDSLATIDDFLFGSRRGYCEQFAGAMAILAREAGVPTRLAVGFVPGERDGEGWAVTARDLHTWPEVWLDGLGWVGFEPTPGRGATTETDGDTPGEASPPPAEPTPSSADPVPSPTPTAAPSPAAPAGPASAPGWIAALPWVLLGAAALATAAALAGPRWRRTRVRAQRLAGTGDPRTDTVAAWDEVRERAARAGVPWPDGSPRFAAERLLPALGGDEEAARALRALAASAERALYDKAERYDGPGAWEPEVTAITAALTRGEGRRNRTSGAPI